MSHKYDFIIVGGGTSGTILSSKLSQTPSHPQILLLESGPDTRELSSDAPAERMLRTISHPHLDQGYSTVFGAGLNNRKLPYFRGRGLGGSTVINYGAWTYGARDDYDYWAGCVGDEMWRWEGVRERLREIEKYHVEMPEGMEVYANPSSEIHGDSGPVDVSLPFTWEKEFSKLIDAAEEVGLRINPDINSGNPIGICMNVSTSYKTTGRTTSTGAYLKKIPSNLDIWTDSKVAKLLFKDKKAIGVELIDGRQVLCNTEIIFSAGAIDSPKILLLSGIGPASELEAYGIQRIHNLPGVGKNLQDHLGVPLMNRMTGDFSDRWAFDSSPEKKEAARKLWNETKTGPMNDHYSNIAVGFDKLPALYETPEFKALDPSLQEYLRKETVPHFELTGGGPNYLGFDFGSDSFLSSMGIGLNLQSRGSITLSSTNPADVPLINFDFLQHPFDRRVLLEGTKLMLKYMKAKAFEPYVKESIMMPTSESDEDILKYIETTGLTALHAAGTVKMGRPDDVMACVDSRFRVFGVEGLRVADMSVCPELTNNHTQATAYLIGQLAAEVLTFDYSL